MDNTLTVEILPDKRVKTEFVTYDGVTSMEIHRHGLPDAKVLKKLLDKNYYQRFKGSWILAFPDDPKLIMRATFEEVIDAAQEYIFSRDNSTDYSGFC